MTQAELTVLRDRVEHLHVRTQDRLVDLRRRALDIIVSADPVAESTLRSALAEVAAKQAVETQFLSMLDAAAQDVGQLMAKAHIASQQEAA